MRHHAFFVLLFAASLAGCARNDCDAQPPCVCGAISVKGDVIGRPQGLPGVAVEVIGYEGETVATTSTGAEGRYSLMLDERGLYGFVAEYPEGVFLAAAEDRVKVGGVFEGCADVSFDLPANGMMEVQFVFPDTESISREGMVVGLGDYDYGSGDYRFDRRGLPVVGDTARITNVRPGQYLLVAQWGQRELHQVFYPSGSSRADAEPVRIGVGKTKIVWDLSKVADELTEIDPRTGQPINEQGFDLRSG